MAIFIPSSQAGTLIVYSDNVPGATITGTAGDIILGTITLPSLTALPKRAFIDVVISQLRNAYGSGNYTSGAQKIQAKLNGGSYTDSISVADTSLVTMPSANIGGSWILTGTTDIISLISSSGIITVKWVAAKAFANSFTLTDYHLRIRMEY